MDDDILSVVPTNFDECIARAVFFEDRAVTIAGGKYDLLSASLLARAKYWRCQAARYLPTRKAR